MHTRSSYYTPDLFRSKNKMATSMYKKRILGGRGSRGNLPVHKSSDIVICSDINSNTRPPL